MRLSPLLTVGFLSIALLSACTSPDERSATQTGASQSLGATVWGTYKSTLGFSIKYPSGWDMNRVGNAVAFYPKSKDAVLGDAGSSAGMDVYFEKGTLENLIAAHNDSENGNCKEAKSIMMGKYNATLLQCVSVFDGTLDENYYVAHEDGYFRLASDVEDPYKTYATMRVSFRITK